MVIKQVHIIPNSSERKCAGEVQLILTATLSTSEDAGEHATSSVRMCQQTHCQGCRPYDLSGYRTQRLVAF